MPAVRLPNPGTPPDLPSRAGCTSPAALAQAGPVPVEPAGVEVPR